ncbi:hypothetical protein HRbin16_01824 [bacterium HR16]|nr:hypothetical protein HRbin16_01824 [bacterium HR16]
MRPPHHSDFQPVTESFRLLEIAHQHLRDIFLIRARRRFSGVFAEQVELCVVGQRLRPARHLCQATQKQTTGTFRLSPPRCLHQLPFQHDGVIARLFLL